MSNAYPDPYAQQAAVQPPRVPQRKKKSRRGVQVFAWIVVLVIAAVVAVGAYFGVRLLKSMDGSPTIPHSDAFPEDSLRPGEYTPPPGASTDKKPVNFLLLGSDSRGEEGTQFDHLGDRSDVIMVAHVTPDRKTVAIMSIMRDSWVEIPGYGYDKVNSALARGGVPLLTQTVESLIDQRIDDVAIIDFQGFKGLTDALGGVTVYNSQDFEAGGEAGGPHWFPAGEITLTGDEALMFVRERKTFIDGDYQRVRNQRAYLSAVINKLLSVETMTNPAKLASSMESFASYVNRTEGFNPQTFAKLGIEMRGKPEMKMFTIPTTGVGWEGDQSVVYLNWEGVEQVQWAFKQVSLRDWTPPGE